MLYDFSKIWVIMGAICFAVSLRTLYYTIYANFEKGAIWGMGCFSWINTKLNWLLRAFALSRSFVIGWSFTRSVGNANIFSFICLNK